MSYPLNAHYQAYSSAYQTLSKTRQVVMLYDGAIKFIMQAKEAIRENRIEDRFALTMKASEIITALQSCLDFDNGGEIAKILYDYYSGMDACIIEINWKNDEVLCDRIVRDLKKLRDAWDQIDRNGNSNNASSGKPQESNAYKAAAPVTAAPAAKPESQKAVPSLSEVPMNNGSIVSESGRVTVSA
jgi:flagellar protein FliS